MTFSPREVINVKKKRKNLNKHFRCSKEDARRLELAAKRAGVTESEYLRAMIGQVAFDTFEKTGENDQSSSGYSEIGKKLDVLINEIHRIGINVNQIAHACNMNPLFYNEDREKLMYYMSNCRKLLLEVVKYCNYEDDAHEFRERK